MHYYVHDPMQLPKLWVRASGGIKTFENFRAGKKCSGGSRASCTLFTQPFIYIHFLKKNWEMVNIVSLKILVSKIFQLEQIITPFRFEKQQVLIDFCLPVPLPGASNVQEHASWIDFCIAFFFRKTALQRLENNIRWLPEFTI